MSSSGFFIHFISVIGNELFQPHKWGFQELHMIYGKINAK